MTSQQVLEEVNDLVILGTDDAFADFINKCDTDIFEGKNCDGETIILGIEKGVGFRVSTYQDNGWIRVNEYYLDYDEDGHPVITRTETYTK